MEIKNKRNFPFFIFGCGRSGTSLLSRMLNAHPNIAVPYESHILNTFYSISQFYGDLSIKKNREALIDDILKTDVMRDWKPPIHKHEIIGSVQRGDLGGILQAILESWALKTGKKRWGEKTPHHINYWGYISRIFPDAKIIHIYRDGRDVALSLLNARFGPKSIYASAHYWVKYLKKIEEVKSKLSSGTIWEVSYEDLLDDPSKTLKDICSFLNEDYSANMLEYYRNKSPYNTDLHNRENLQKPVLRDNKFKWKYKMPKKELQLFESIAGSYLWKYGYELSGLEVVTLSPAEELYHKYIKSYPPKALAMLRNRKGHRDALIRFCIYLRRRFLYTIGIT